MEGIIMFVQQVDLPGSVLQGGYFINLCWVYVIFISFTRKVPARSKEIWWRIQVGKRFLMNR
jgi:hypothetical protein